MRGGRLHGTTLVIIPAVLTLLSLPFTWLTVCGKASFGLFCAVFDELSGAELLLSGTIRGGVTHPPSAATWLTVVWACVALVLAAAGSLRHPATRAAVLWIGTILLGSHVFGDRLFPETRGGDSPFWITVLGAAFALVETVRAGVALVRRPRHQSNAA